MCSWTEGRKLVPEDIELILSLKKTVVFVKEIFNSLVPYETESDITETI